MNSYELIDGVKCYAPEKAYVSESGFSEDMLRDLCVVEANSFWFKARNRIIIYLLRKYIDRPKFQMIEVGCGNGFVLSGISKEFPGAELTGSEIGLTGVKHLMERFPALDFVQMDVNDMKITEAFDVVGTFDVLEHLDDDVSALRGIFKALRRQGKLFITVPQHQALWSNVDIMAGHKRRYAQSDIVRKLETVGFKVIRTCSFVSLLLPLVYLSRDNRKEFSVEELRKQQLRQLLQPRLIDLILTMAIRVDELFIRAGINIPCGSSLFVVAVKP